jgi:hypothetical protein
VGNANDNRLRNRRSQSPAGLIGFVLVGENSSLQHAWPDIFLFAKKAFAVRLMLNLVAAAEESPKTDARLGP